MSQHYAGTGLSALLTNPIGLPDAAYTIASVCNQHQWRAMISLAVVVLFSLFQL